MIRYSVYIKDYRKPINYFDTAEEANAWIEAEGLEDAIVGRVWVNLNG